MRRRCPAGNLGIWCPETGMCVPGHRGSGCQGRLPTEHPDSSRLGWPPQEAEECRQAGSRWSPGRSCVTGRGPEAGRGQRQEPGRACTLGEKRKRRSYLFPQGPIPALVPRNRLQESGERALEAALPGGPGGRRAREACADHSGWGQGGGVSGARSAPQRCPKLRGQAPAPPASAHGEGPQSSNLDQEGSGGQGQKVATATGVDGGRDHSTVRVRVAPKLCREGCGQGEVPKPPLATGPETRPSGSLSPGLHAGRPPTVATVPTGPGGPRGPLLWARACQRGRPQGQQEGSDTLLPRPPTGASAHLHLRSPGPRGLGPRSQPLTGRERCVLRSGAFSLF